MTKPTRMSLGGRLRRERLRRNWTQDYVAKQIGASTLSLNRWENGKATPHADMLNALIALFGLPVEVWGGSRPRIWTVPFLQNMYFTGREAVLTSLHAALSDQTIVAVSQRRAISGLGGIGKTQIALEYAFRYEDEYDLVLWVRADSRETLVAQLAELAALLGLPERTHPDQIRQAKAVKRYLETHQDEAWLLIFDNVDDVAMVSEFLPTRGNGAMLLTTRLHAVGKHMRKIDLDKLSPEESMQFLLKRKDAAGEHTLQSLPKAEHQAAEQLCALLDGLPLALDQAAAYIEQYGCSFSDYLARYLQQRATFLSMPNKVDQRDYPASVATTWLFSFQQVELADPIAADVLHLCAFLHPDGIPAAVLLSGAADMLPSFQTVAADLARLQAAIEMAQKYSLLRYNPKTNMLSLHRLVQAIIQDGLGDVGKREWATQAVLAVNAAFPAPSDQADWPQCEQLLPHALLAAHAVAQYNIVSEAAGRLLFETASYLQDRARYAEAEPLFVRSLAIREHCLGSEHLDVAASLNGLADLYREQGKHAEAEPLFQRALAIREQRLGPDEIRVAVSLTNVANLYRDQGKHAEAEPLYLRARRIFALYTGTEPAPTTLAPRHVQLLYSKLMSNLAALYVEQGKYAEAEPLCQEAIAIIEQQTGGDFLDIAFPLSNLAIVYKEQGRYAEAEPLYLRSQRMWEQHLGPDHPQMALALNNLAELYKDQARYAEAEPLYQRAYRIWEHHLGPDHLLVGIVQNNLADIALEQGRSAEAEPLYQRALRVFEHGAGAQNYLRAYALNGLANVARAQGRYAKAEALFQQALQIREQVWGANHPETAETLHDLARLREAQGKREEARDLYQRALTVREAQLGAQHPKTVATRKHLVALLRALGHHAEAARFAVP
jgi:tetratricopeptide (TPR) repeat protein/transcriptional regulator with XRE-family HTH domain